MRVLILVSVLVIFGLSARSQCIVGNAIAPATEDGTNLVAQSFTATCSGLLEYVEFFVASTGTNTGGTLSIYSGSTVLNTPIHTQPYPATALNAGDAFRIYLDPPLPISITNVRTFEMTMSLDVSYSTTNPYSGGRFFYNGTNSSVYEDIDMKFNASIMLNCSHTSSSFPVDACQEYMAPSGVVWTSSGIYMDTIPNVAGCDSVMTIDLTLTTVDTSVVANGLQLTVGEIGADYQWVDCDNGNSPIPGATQQSFTAPSSGNYAVEVTANGCTVLSDCYFVGSTAIHAVDEGEPRIWPNPCRGDLYLEGMDSNTDVVLFDLVGRSVPFERAGKRLQISEPIPGIYFLRYAGKEDKVKVLRIVVER